VKLFYGAGDRGAWSLGTKFILKDRGTNPPIYEGINTRFIKEKTTIPIPAVAQEWTENNNRHFLIAERVPGLTLEEHWPKMSQADREDLAKETAEYLAQLRQLHSPKMQSVHGQPLYCAFLFSGDHGSPHGPLSSADELWAEMSGELDDIPEKVRELIRQRMPHPEPWTFTHGDLTICNIMVDPNTNKLSGIIDWEASGYYPVWWEFACASIGLSEDDRQWKELLRKYTVDYTPAYEFGKDVKACTWDQDWAKERRKSLWQDCGLEIE
jgi:aminoglycoside phosphotransferase (APT) family kinase protein